MGILSKWAWYNPMSSNVLADGRRWRIWKPEEWMDPVYLCSLKVAGASWKGLEVAFSSRGSPLVQSVRKQGLSPIITKNWILSKAGRILKAVSRQYTLLVNVRINLRMHSENVEGRVGLLTYRVKKQVWFYKAKWMETYYIAIKTWEPTRSKEKSKVHIL